MSNRDTLCLIELEREFMDEADGNVSLIVNEIHSDPTLFARLLLEARRCPGTVNAYREILEIAAEIYAERMLKNED